MTAPTAAAAILVLFDSAVFSPDMIAFAFEITLMAGGAEGRVAGRRIYKYGVYAGAVAAAATRVSSVIARVIPLRVMAEAGRRPAAGHMALVTLNRRRQMALWLEGRPAAGAVAVVAPTNGGVVVNPDAVRESRRGMAEVAIQSGCDMRRVRLGGHTDRGRPVMTGRAVVHDAGMVEAGRNEVPGVVADPAILTGGQVSVAFTRRETGIVTGRAVVDDADMVEGRWPEPRRLVAVDAVAIGRHVPAGLSCRGIPVVAGPTVTRYALVIEMGLGKRRRRVTSRAIFAGRNVGRIDPGILAGRIDAVVAGRTVVDDSRMVEHCGCKGAAGNVTGAAILTGNDVRRIDLGIFAGRIEPVVAGVASTA